MKKIALRILVLVISSYVPTHAANLLDETFNAAGTLPGTNSTVIDGTGTDNVGKTVAIQDDGKSVLAGEANIGGDILFAIARFETDGTLDVTASTVIDGTGTVNIGESAALQNDQKIVVVGQAAVGGETRFAVARFDTDFTLDTLGFNSGGAGPGTLSTHIDNETVSTGKDVVIQPADQFIVVAGSVIDGGSGLSKFALARYETDGTLDATFTNGGPLLGTVSTAVVDATKDAVGLAVALQIDGKIVVVGGVTDGGGDQRFAIARFNTNGTLDATFNAAGAIPGTNSATANPGEESVAYSVAIQDDGKIVIGGQSFIGGQGYFATARFNADGTLDTTFNSGGVGGVTPGTAVTEIDPGNGSQAFKVLLDANENILLSGFTGAPPPIRNKFALARFTSNGILDTTFNPLGANPGTTATIVVNANSSNGRGMALQSDGKIVMTGSADVDAGTNQFGVARFIPTSETTPVALDTSVTTPFNTPVTITLTATNEDAALLTFSIVSGPTHGTLSAITQPSVGGTTQTATVTYTPTTGFIGADSFTFQVANGGTTSNIATVSITVEDIPSQTCFVRQLVEKYGTRV